MNKRRAPSGRRIGDEKKRDDHAPRKKFDYEEMKAAAAHADPAVRKAAFIEYFERFEEFPSYLFENKPVIDERLLKTIHDLLKDTDTSKEMHKGLVALLGRLQS